MKKIMLFPYNKDSVTLLNNFRGNKEYEIAMICSFKEDTVAMTKEFESKRIFLTNDFEKYAKEVDAVVFCENVSKIDPLAYLKKIEYLSNSKVNVKYETKIIDIDEVDIDGKDEKEIERRFLKRYGRKLPKNKIDNVEDISKMMDLYMELLKEKFETAKRTRKYDVSNGEMELDKIKGKWTSKELEEYIREINKAMRVK